MKKVLSFILVLVWCSTALASPKPPLPPEQWTPQAYVWLSRAVVAEADWKAETDHILIGWALTYRWRQQVRRWPHMRFVDVVRGYCAGLGLGGARTPRQRWVRRLPVPIEDETWPQELPRDRRKLWTKVLERMLLWGEGRLRDPSRGRVRHWGSPSPELPDLGRSLRQVEEGKWVLLEIEGTANQFFGYAPQP